MMTRNSADKFWAQFDENIRAECLDFNMQRQV